MENQHPAVEAFQSTAREVPAYQQVLTEKGIAPESIQTLEDFQRLVPVLDKHQTFGRFPVSQMCRQGTLGTLAGVLTSSGHSGLTAARIAVLTCPACESRKAGKTGCGGCSCSRTWPRCCR